MAYLAKGRKEDLLKLIVELELVIPPSRTIVELIRCITSSEDYDEEITKSMLSVIIEEREAEVRQRERQREDDVRREERVKRLRLVEMELEKLRQLDDNIQKNYDEPEQKKYPFSPRGPESCEKESHSKLSEKKEEFSRNQNYFREREHRNAPIRNEVLICYHCQCQGHFARACPNIQKSSQSKRKQTETHKEEMNVMYQQKNEHELKTAHLNKNKNRKVSCKIDMGTSSCIISREVAEELRLGYSFDKTKIFGMNGSFIQSVGKTTCEVEVDSVKVQNVEMFIVEPKAIPFEMILGRNFINRVVLVCEEGVWSVKSVEDFGLKEMKMSVELGKAELVNEVKVDIEVVKVVDRQVEVVKVVDREVEVIKEVDSQVEVVKVVDSQSEVVKEVKSQVEVVKEVESQVEEVVKVVGAEVVSQVDVIEVDSQEDDIGINRVEDVIDVVSQEDVIDVVSQEDVSQEEVVEVRRADVVGQEEDVTEVVSKEDDIGVFRVEDKIEVASLQETVEIAKQKTNVMNGENKTGDIEGGSSCESEEELWCFKGGTILFITFFPVMIAEFGFELWTVFQLSSGN